MIDWFLLYGFYIAYFLFLVAFAIYSYFATYHLQEFGFVGDACKPVSTIYFALCTVILAITVIALII